MAEIQAQDLSLESLAEGALVDEFDRLLQDEILPDLENPSKKHDAKRRLTVTLEMWCTSEDRHVVGTSWVVDAKTAKRRARGGTAFLSREGGQLRILVSQDRQTQIPTNNVHAFGRKES